MNLELDESQAMLRDAVRRVLVDLYRSGQRRRMAGLPQGRDPAAWQQLAALGLLGLGISERFGGTGPADLEVAIVAEELGRVCALEPFVASMVLAAGAIEALGSEPQRSAWLPAIVSGERVVGWAAGSAAGVRATATPAGWSLQGTIRPADYPIDAACDAFVIEATLADSDETLVLLVSRETPGLGLVPCPSFGDDKVWGLQLADVAVGAGDRLAGTSPAEVTRAMTTLTQRSMAATAAEATGIMSAMMDLTIAHLRTRQQFGSPLARFQALQHRLVDMSVALEDARSMSIWATVALADADEAARHASLAAAQIQVAHSCRVVGQQAVQLHGGIGLTLEYDLAPLFLRTARIHTGHGGIEHQLQLLTAAGGLNPTDHHGH